jgi:DNA-binding XRE family transcriptional regulator
MGLMQEEAAQRVGISRRQYFDLETGAVEHYEKEMVDKLAALFGVPPTDFLDEYNLFLYKGQGEQVREYRVRCGLEQGPMARALHVDVRMLQAWETEQKQMTRASWEKYFKGK